MREPIRVAVTGAAGQIGYALLPRIANGDVFGPDQPVILQLLEITPALGALEGVRMELVDCAPPLLMDIVCTDDPNVAFADAGAAFLVGAKPRSKGMERKDLLRENGPIFTAQGKALSDNAARNVKVLVVGNPANTNALIALSHAKNLSPSQFHAMTRLDHNRAMAQLAGKARAAIADVDGVTIWGNHSATQYPDYSQATIGGKPVSQVIDDVAWLRGEFITTVQQRGAAIIAARGLSSAASAAHAAICHMRDWHGGQKGTRWVSMAVPTDGSYDVPEGIVFSFPCRCEGNGTYSIVKGLAVDDFGRAKLSATIEELLQERAAVQELL